MRRLVIGPDAYGDIGSAALWYAERSPGLGDDFLRALDALLAQVERTPQRFPSCMARFAVRFYAASPTPCSSSTSTTRSG